MNNPALCIFDTAKQLVAYAGLDPSVYQSGSFRAKNIKISERGTPYLRRHYSRLLQPLLEGDQMGHATLCYMNIIPIK